MNHIKDNWVEGELFNASDLNDIARALNALVDRRESLINDNVISDESVYSSNKINNIADESKASLINDSEASGNSTYSSDKIAKDIDGAKFRTVFLDKLPEIGKENTMYITLPDNVEIQQGGPCLIEDNDGTIRGLNEDVTEFNFKAGDVFRYKKPTTKDYKYIALSDINKDRFTLFFNVHETGENVTDDIIAGVNSSITLQDGHYYRVKDSFLLGPDNILMGADSKSLFVFYSLFIQGKIGIRVLTYEEIQPQSYVDYDNVEVVQCFIAYSNMPYKRLPIFTSVIMKMNEDGRVTYYPVTPGTYKGHNYSMPGNIKKGDIIKVTGDNKFENEGEIIENIFTVASEVYEGRLIYEDGYLQGIKSSYIWQKNEFYRITGKHKVESEDSGMTSYLYTFEKVTGVDAYDYKIEWLPGIYFDFSDPSIITNSFGDKWMWINGEWELISKAKITTENN